MAFFDMSQIAKYYGIVLPISILMIETDDDREFICRLYIDYRKLMFAVAYEYFNENDSDIDDVVGITVERLCRYCSTVRKIPENRIKQYIVSITGNVCRDLLRKRKRLGDITDTSYTDKMLEEIPDSHNPIDTIFDQASAQELIAAFDLLPLRERELIRMRHVDKSSIGIIAKELNISENTARTALSRARKHLIKLLNSRKE